MHTIQSNLDEIIKELSAFDGKYKKNYVNAAIENREKITPCLLNILEEILKNPNKAIKDDNFYGHIYALMLFGSFKETKAHKLIIDLFSLPEDVVDALFGDIITENLPMLLYNTCGGSFEEIKAFILNKDVEEYCRISGMRALVYAVEEGILPRREALEFMTALLAEKNPDTDTDFWSYVVCCICDLHPGESMDVIEKAFEDELVCPGIINLEDVENYRKMTVEGCMGTVRKDFKRRSLDDIHKSMSCWACFENSTDAFRRGLSYSEKRPDAKKKKRKRKQAKSSKKKNRRR